MSSHSHDGKTSTCKNCIDAKSSEREMRQQRLGDLAGQFILSRIHAITELK